MEMEKDKVVLAYSGGLDTSVCIKWLMEEKGLDVIAVTGDVGQERQDLEFVKKKALQVGAIEALAIDMREEFVNDFLTKALAANCMYENKYPMVSALSRPVISKNLVEIAHKYGAKYIAHGCTGKGNDQVRFEVAPSRASTPKSRCLPPCASGICIRAMTRWSTRRITASPFPRRRHRPIPSTITFGVAPSSAASSRIRGASRSRTSTR